MGCFQSVSQYQSVNWSATSISNVHNCTRSRTARIKHQNIGSRAFPVAGASIWNTLPLHVTSASSLTVFKQRLKLHLFGFSFPGLSPLWLLSGPCSVCCHLGYCKNCLTDWLIDHIKRLTQSYIK